MIPYLTPNQRLIRIERPIADRDNPYTLINKEALDKALYELKPSAFKVWGYMCGQLSGYEFALSTAYLAEALSMNVKTVQGAVNELIEKGYLVKIKLHPNLMGYIFLQGGSD